MVPQMAKLLEHKRPDPIMNSDGGTGRKTVLGTFDPLSISEGRSNRASEGHCSDSDIELLAFIVQDMDVCDVHRPPSLCSRSHAEDPP